MTDSRQFSTDLQQLLLQGGFDCDCGKQHRCDLQHLCIESDAIARLPELLRECYALAEENGALFGMHLAETENETSTCLKEFGMRPIPYCNSLGLLQPRKKPRSRT